jgi:hypothetical protein
MAKSETRTSKQKRAKQPTQRPPMQTVVVMGPTGKLRMERRPW